MRTNDLRVGRVAGMAVMGLALCVGTGRPSQADDAARFKISRTVVVNEVGDAQVKLAIKMSAESYTTAKSNNPNTAVLLRRLGAGTHWVKMENVRGQFEDNTSTVAIEYTQLGVARLAGDDLWEIALESDSKADLVASFDNTAVLSSVSQTDLGMATLNLRIEGPKGAKSLQLEHSPERVTYRFAPKPAQGTSPAAAFTLDAKSQVMSSLAKSAADSRLTGLWVARSVFKNTGDQVLNEYRVRFRIPAYSDFSEWKRSKRVLPGQTVVDAFFPVFEAEKLAQATGSRPLRIEVEYEYRQQDGRTVREGDSHQVQLLGRNQAVFSSCSADEAVGFYDKYNNAPLILAALVAGSDSLMQELSGRMTQLSGSLPTQKDEDAQKFLANLYAFLGTNNVGLQTPLGEEVRYGRDVLRNRAGTYVDLAVLFASVCDAAGLKPVLYLLPGNCLPAVRLPGGQIVALDVTQTGSLSFAKAVEEGAKKLIEAQTKGQLYAVDVAKWRSLGVQSLELAPFEAGFLDKNYRFAATSQSYQVTTSTQTQTSTGEVKRDSKLLGRWTLQQMPEGRTVQFTLVLSADGKYTYRAVVTAGSQPTSDSQEAGSFEQGDTSLKFLPADGKQPNVYFYRLRGDELDLQLQGSPTLVTFQRSK
jgi:hypothetical protein